MTSTPQYGKLSQKFLRPAFAFASVAMAVSLVSCVLFVQPLMFLLAVSAISHFAYIVLLRKAVNCTIATPDLEYNFGYGKYRDFHSVLNFALLGAGISVILLSAINPPHPEIQSIQLFTSFSAGAMLLNAALSAVRERYLRNFIISSDFDENNYSDLRLATGGKSAGLRGIHFDYTSVLWAYITYSLCILFNVNEYIIQSAIATIIIAFLLVRTAKSTRVSLSNLLDRNLPEHILFDFLSVVIENNDYICEYKSMRTRRSGEEIFIDIDAIMPCNMPLSALHALEIRIASSLREKYPTARPRLHAIPCTQNCVFIKSEQRCAVMQIHKTKEK
ncbi:MAG: cation transporter dimerization domain-containing protein [Candidatus Kapabacteria bacterium]|nr:cation transporter dimerization domain-containing protein [Candidatus Kapabacteria bacterium]